MSNFLEIYEIICLLISTKSLKRRVENFIFILARRCNVNSKVCECGKYFVRRLQGESVNIDFTQKGKKHEEEEEKNVKT